MSKLLLVSGYMVMRRFVWKVQIRENESRPWRDDDVPKTVEVPDFKTGNGVLPSWHLYF
ncbi:hypothetical protein [Candidatus Nitrososphaera evergladensis]|uniref:hypothetical protein n=1 Tax=Candidatus Nitrososphaera evergladensis TaxID=1459637 RepID=UPI00130E0B9C|nr:hypothetical protein [Candidatus Nitrososphaera evergladensis]